jgi:hypothetical protein
MSTNENNIKSKSKKDKVALTSSPSRKEELLNYINKLLGGETKIHQKADNFYTEKISTTRQRAVMATPSEVPIVGKVPLVSNGMEVSADIIGEKLGKVLAHEEKKDEYRERDADTQFFKDASSLITQHATKVLSYCQTLEKENESYKKSTYKNREPRSIELIKKNIKKDEGYKTSDSNERKFINSLVDLYFDEYNNKKIPVAKHTKAKEKFRNAFYSHHDDVVAECKSTYEKNRLSRADSYEEKLTGSLGKNSTVQESLLIRSYYKMNSEEKLAEEILAKEKLAEEKLAEKFNENRNKETMSFLLGNDESENDPLGVNSSRRTSKEKEINMAKSPGLFTKKPIRRKSDSLDANSSRRTSNEKSASIESTNKSKGKTKAVEKDEKDEKAHQRPKYKKREGLSKRPVPPSIQFAEKLREIKGGNIKNHEENKTNNPSLF